MPYLPQPIGEHTCDLWGFTAGITKEVKWSQWIQDGRKTSHRKMDLQSDTLFVGRQWYIRTYIYIYIDMTYYDILRDVKAYLIEILKTAFWLRLIPSSRLLHDLPGLPVVDIGESFEDLVAGCNKLIRLNPTDEDQASWVTQIYRFLWQPRSHYQFRPIHPEA